MAHITLFFDWDTKGYFYRQEPAYFFKDFVIFVKYFIIKLKKSFSKKQADIDLKAAKEAYHYRKSILETNSSSDYEKMDSEQLANEINRLHVRDK